MSSVTEVMEVMERVDTNIIGFLSLTTLTTTPSPPSTTPSFPRRALLSPILCNRSSPCRRYFEEQAESLGPEDSKKKTRQKPMAHGATHDKKKTIKGVDYKNKASPKTTPKTNGLAQHESQVQAQHEAQRDALIEAEKNWRNAERRKKIATCCRVTWFPLFLPVIVAKHMASDIWNFLDMAMLSMSVATIVAQGTLLDMASNPKVDHIQAADMPALDACVKRRDRDGGGD